MAKNNWWRKGSKEEDEVVSQAADELIGGVCDADSVGNVQQNVGVNLRDQVTIEELEDWHKDRQLRRMGNRN